MAEGFRDDRVSDAREPKIVEEVLCKPYMEVPITICNLMAGASRGDWLQVCKSCVFARQGGKQAEKRRRLQMANASVTFSQLVLQT